MFARVNDEWWSHPKILGCPLSARGLWITALSWSCHQRTDHVPTSFVALVDGTDDDTSELVSRGLWHAVDGGWVIHDWSEYQEKTVSEKRAEAGAKGGRARGSKQTGSNVDVASEANGQAGPSSPDPSLPDPSLLPSISGLTRYGVDADAVWDHIARVNLKDRQAKGGDPVRDPEAWLRRARVKAAATYCDKAAALVAAFVVSDPAELGDLALERRSTRYLERRVA